LLVDYFCLKMKRSFCIVVYGNSKTLEVKAQQVLDIPHGGISRNLWGRMFP
jgi:hypothetical protein